MFKLYFASAWGSNIENRTYVILTYCPLPGGFLPDSHSSFAFSPFDSFSCSSCFCPLPPLLSPCSCLPLLLGLPSLPLLISSSVPPLRALESYCWEKCESVWLPERLYQGTLGGQSPKIDFGPRSQLVRTALKMQPVKTQALIVLERLCNGLSDEQCAMTKWISDLLA